MAVFVAMAVVLLGGCNSTIERTGSTTGVSTVDPPAIVTTHSPASTITVAQIPDAPGVPISTAAAAPPAPGTQTQNTDLTPGLADPAVTQADIETTICVTGYTATVRAVTASTKAKVYSEYGITTPTSGAYEIDHLIPLELGGSNDIGNLWPETAIGADDSHAKDTWENALHGEVCAGTMTLSVAQDEMVHWWVLVGAVANPTTFTSTTQPTVSEPTPGASSGAVKPGAFCDPVGAQGTYNGASYVCSTTSASGVAYKDDRAHWRHG